MSALVQKIATTSEKVPTEDIVEMFCKVQLQSVVFVIDLSFAAIISTLWTRKCA